MPTRPANATFLTAIFPLVGLLAAIFVLPEVYGYIEVRTAAARESASSPSAPATLSTLKPAASAQSVPQKYGLGQSFYPRIISGRLEIPQEAAHSYASSFRASRSLSMQ